MREELEITLSLTMGHRNHTEPSAHHIYEKLRKRSWRRWTRNGAYSVYDSPAWGRHDAYLKGVRDALVQAGHSFKVG